MLLKQLHNAWRNNDDTATKTEQHDTSNNNDPTQLRDTIQQYQYDYKHDYSDDPTISIATTKHFTTIIQQCGTALFTNSLTIYKHMYPDTTDKTTLGRSDILLFPTISAKLSIDQTITTVMQRYF